MIRRFLQNPAVETAPLNEERILFDSKTNRFVVLNDTSAFLWEQLSVPRSLEELTEDLYQAFDVEPIAEARRDVERALQELQSLDFVIPEEA